MQDQELQRVGWQKGYFVPSSKDRAVTALRRWLGQVGPLPWARSALQPLAGVSKRELLDRFEQHTRGCPSCSKVNPSAPLGSSTPAVLVELPPWHATRVLYSALAGVQAFRVFSALRVAACFAATLAFAGLLGRLQMGRAAMLPAGAALAMCALAVWANRMRQRFIYLDYVHAEH